MWGGEGEGNSPIVEMHKNITVEAEDSEQEVDKHERGNSTPEATHRSRVTDLCNLGILAYKIKCKWEEQLNRTELSL
jgi:hypothetical protein